MLYNDGVASQRLGVDARPSNFTIKSICATKMRLLSQNHILPGGIVPKVCTKTRCKGNLTYVTIVLLIGDNVITYAMM
jgi:hypothetical protein